MIKARIVVTLKHGVLDPQGKAIEGALGALGFSDVGTVRQGKVFDVEIEGDDRSGIPDELIIACRSFARQTAALNNHLRRMGGWEAHFTDQQVNGWLAVDVPKNHPDLLPPEISHPRV